MKRALTHLFYKICLLVNMTQASTRKAVLIAKQCNQKPYVHEVVAINRSQGKCIHTHYTKHFYHNHTLYYALSHAFVHTSSTEKHLGPTIPGRKDEELPQLTIHALEEVTARTCIWELAEGEKF